MTEESPEEISIQSAEAKTAEKRVRYDQSRTLRFASNDTIVSHLLKMGFIRKVVSNDGLRVEHEVTPAGMQFLADYEDINFQVIDFLSNLKLKTSVQQSHMTRVSILIPALNEAENIEVLLNKLAAILPGMAETTVVDGGSTDTTVRVATALGATVMLQKGTGKGDALRQAFESDHAGDIIMVMDADGSNRPEEVPQLVAAIVNGADIAKGSRFLKEGGSTDLSFIRRIGNKFFTSVVNHAWSGEYTDLCYGFMAFRQDALQKLMPFLESVNFQIETEICIKARKLGLKVVEIPSIELKRRYGASKLRGFQDSLSIAKVVLRELFSGLKPSDNP
jgi:cellulose synthase/poly-beta-1,6-N-acetylglucosamine synthase-like glycosyltransferase